ncbi:MAG: hypothetical protein IJS32_08210 [Kiritimatiellae bacterium]|nr:hypothetical protein [Kiritimatiellia bacterium]
MQRIPAINLPGIGPIARKSPELSAILQENRRESRQIAAKTTKLGPQKASKWAKFGKKHRNGPRKDAFRAKNSSESTVFP